MDPDPPSEIPRKVKFAPKGPPRRPAKSATTKIETVAEDDGSDDIEAEQRALLRRVEDLARRGSKVEKKSSVQVVFSHGVASTPLRTFGKPRERTMDKSEAADAEEVAFDNRQISFASPSTDKTEIAETCSDSTDAVIKKKKREYMEPWDYEHSNYPVTLPLRRPYSGDPELLDEAEFEDNAKYDENTLCSAKDLDLLDQDDTPKMLLFQFPANLPLDRVDSRTNQGERAHSLKVIDKSDANQKEILGSSFPSAPLSAAAKGKQIAGNAPSVSTSTKGKGISGNGYDSRKKIGLEELPKGCMGKMLVYKSGNVKLKLGDILYDVSPGSECTFAQNIVAINTSDRHCCELGALMKRAVVSPDIDSMLDNVINLG
ncbi:uncharacterized protein [Primulina huaijiensis]|uniref:uncharacterized protein n=1 Tax=Primulina huaijiensis TaxID=1492673 RepID=UPI003CC76F82